MHTVRIGPLLAMACLTILMVACSQPTPAILNLSVANDAAVHRSITVPLVHQPTATADLVWNAQKKHLIVTLHLTGLTPSSSHPAHIHSGSCQVGGGAMLFMLHPVLADALGVGISKTELAGITTGIPKSGWYINVHNGPNLTPDAQFLPIACGNIAYSRQAKNLHIDLGGTSAADQHASGEAQLSIQQNTLVVTVTIRGLAPRSVHMEHIHAGRCEAQRKVVFMLQNLVADNNGNATATTRIDHVKQIPTNGWYLNVHRTSVLTNPNGQVNPTNFDPIACGNIQAK